MLRLAGDEIAPEILALLAERRQAEVVEALIRQQRAEMAIGAARLGAEQVQPAYLQIAQA